MSDTPGPRFFADASHQKGIYAHLKSDSQQPDSSGSNRSGTLPNSPQSPDQNSGASSAREVASQLIELSTSRFVGDLSPESIFIEATSKTARDPSRRNPSDIGTWLPAPRRNDDEGDARRERSVTTQDHESTASQGTRDGPASLRTLSGRLASSPSSPEHQIDIPQSQYVPKALYVTVERVSHFPYSNGNGVRASILDSSSLQHRLMAAVL